MTTQPLESSFVEADLKAKDNNAEHHTDEVSTAELIVRRGQGFCISLKFKDPYDPKADQLTFTASTGELPDESKGTKVTFEIPDLVKRSGEAKAVWRAKVDQKESSPATGHLVITITPPADALIGKYTLYLKRSALNRELGTLSVLFNPWCPDDSVYMEDETERQEYVMNQSGVIYRGSSKHITSTPWDYGQFEDGMVEICLRLLNKKPKDFKDLAGDESSYSDPIYIGRVVSAMINSVGDMGVLQGRWSGNYEGGKSPSYWNGSYTILKRWYDSGCQAVKYGQCWVFAGVMCSVMRLLGIPCRVVTNFASAHDCNRNLVIDVYHAGIGVSDIHTKDSVWNYHVWVEAWMKRPDLGLDSKLDGWQTLDATPQEASDGVFCCGPAPVRAIRYGIMNVYYDVPFVFAEVNADRIDWLMKADGSKILMRKDTESMGQKISTKSVGTDIRMDLTDDYKYKEGTEEERTIFKLAVFLNDLDVKLEEMSMSSYDALDSAATNSILVEKVEDTPTTVPKIVTKFEEVSPLVNGKDVKLNLVLQSEATEPRPLSINIRVTAKSYNGSAHSEIHYELKEDTLMPGKELCVPVTVPFLLYWKPMLNYDVMRVSAIVADAPNDSEVYLAVEDVVLVNPLMEVKALNEAQVGQKLFVEIAFVNPVAETLKNCTLTLSGSGLFKEQQDVSLPDLGPNRKIRVKMCFYPHKAKQKTLVLNFSCSVFSHIKNTLPIFVKSK